MTFHILHILFFLWVISIIGGGWILVLRLFARVWGGKFSWWLDIILFANLIVGFVVLIDKAFNFMDVKFVW